jgi:hypothetical protein
MDRRTGFFLGAAALCLLLAPVAGEYTWVAIMVAVVYSVLAAASWLEDRSRRSG